MGVTLSGQAGKPLVSIIIPCYNQGSFLADAVDSALHQTYSNCEVVLVDDGSTDDTPTVAARFAHVHYLRQDNQGLPAARNTGLGASHGRFLVFLDADDRLLPGAVDAGLAALRSRPDCVFAAGRFRLIGPIGGRLWSFRGLKDDQSTYVTLLRGNFIGMHAAVIYQREAFDRFGGFDRALPACEDYEFFLRVTRQAPIVCHDSIVAEYRKHLDNMSADADLMFRSTVRVLQAQLPVIQDDPVAKRAYREGIRRAERSYLATLVRRATGLEPLAGPSRSRIGSLWGLLAYVAPIPLQCARPSREMRRLVRDARRGVQGSAAAATSVFPTRHST